MRREEQLDGYERTIARQEHEIKLLREAVDRSNVALEEAIKATEERNALRLEVNALKPLVEAAREMIGLNVSRPQVYEATDTGKYKLALALQGITEHRSEKCYFCGKMDGLAWMQGANPGCGYWRCEPPCTRRVG